MSAQAFAWAVLTPPEWVPVSVDVYANMRAWLSDLSKEAERG